MTKYAFIALCLIQATVITAADAIPTLAIGAQAPDFSLPGIDGKTYTLKSFSDAKILVIIFTCNHCPSAQAYEERMKKLVVDYQPKGVQLVAINPNNPKSVRLDELGYTDLNDSFEEMKIRAAYVKYNFPYLDDGETQAVSRAYGPRVTPHAFVFDAERKLRYVGRIDDNEREEYAKVFDLRNALDALVAGKDPEVKETKAGGCSTKWLGKEDSVKNFMAKLAAEPVTVEPADEEALKALRNNESGKLRLVNFWATNCGPCVTEFPDLVTINRMYRNRAFEMVTVAANFPDEKPEVLKFLQAKQASGKNLIFAGTDKYKLMAAFDKDWDASLPYTVLFGTKGEVIHKVNGAFDPLELKRVIVKALRELNKGAVMDEKKKK
jgi:thiol-disulfide isomerase/thioredoxin